MKIACFDIEATALDADRGRMLCACFKPFGEKVRTIRLDDAPTFTTRPTNDRWVVKRALKELQSYDMVITWYGERYDLPFLRSRAVRLNIGTQTKTLFHLDLWRVCRAALKLTSNRLANVQKFLQLPDEKTPLDFSTWAEATAGNKKVMREIVEHCEADVVVLEQAYERLLPYVRTLHRATV